MPLPRTILFRRRPRDREKPNNLIRFYTSVVSLFTSCFVAGDQTDNVSYATKQCKDKNRNSIIKRFKRSQRVAPMNIVEEQSCSNGSDSSKRNKSTTKLSNSEFLFYSFYTHVCYQN